MRMATPSVVARGHALRASDSAGRTARRSAKTLQRATVACTPVRLRRDSSSSDEYLPEGSPRSESRTAPRRRATPPARRMPRPIPNRRRDGDAPGSGHRVDRLRTFDDPAAEVMRVAHSERCPINRPSCSATITCDSPAGFSKSTASVTESSRGTPYTTSNSSPSAGMSSIVASQGSSTVGSALMNSEVSTNAPSRTTVASNSNKGSRHLVAQSNRALGLPRPLPGPTQATSAHPPAQDFLRG